MSGGIAQIAGVYRRGEWDMSDLLLPFPSASVREERTNSGRRRPRWINVEPILATPMTFIEVRCDSTERARETAWSVMQVCIERAIPGLLEATLSNPNFRKRRCDRDLLN